MFRPPAPAPLSPVRALARHVMDRERDLLTLLPRDAYVRRVGRLGFSRRAILLVNEPAAVREVMIDRAEEFPKNDLFDGALSPLVRDSVFNSHGDRWRGQRALIEPAFAHMQVRRAFEAMSGACDDAEARLDAAAEAGQAVALDAAMSRVTADVVFRAIFSESLESEAAREIFEAFAEYQATVAQIGPAELILGRAFETPEPPAACRAACETIRARLRAWIAARLEGPAREDIVGALIAARHPQTGGRFDLEELVDQIGVFFLAGHETTAGALTWAVFMLSQDEGPAQALRAEVEAAAGDGPVTLEHVKKLHRARAAFREAMRLYPPLPFLPRVALDATTVGGEAVPRGAMIMIAPWTLHRCEGLWEAPDRFDPDRFLPEREKTIPKGAYLPFGLGPRLCVGAAFATIEATMILARLMRRYAWRAEAAERVRPLVRLTLRPAEPILMRLSRR